jgi:hypothetical protein
MKIGTVRAAWASVLSLALTGSAFAQAEAPPPPTLWNFLGIPQAFDTAHAQLFNRRGNFPKTEKKPPLKAIGDPANLKSDVPAIKAAAEIKQAEDLKLQKIKAIKYLAEIGCGCYDKDEKVTKALVAAMEDCTEDVRLAAVEAIKEAACGEQCAQCKRKSCCNEKISQQLAKIANEVDDSGCWAEPSERVRQAAAAALAACCPLSGPPAGEEPERIERTEPTPEVERREGATETPPAPPSTHTDSSPSDRSALVVPGAAPGTAPLPAVRLTSSRRTAMRFLPSPSEAIVLPPSQTSPRGAVMLVDAARNLAHVHFAEGSSAIAVGTRLQVYKPSETGYQHLGELEVTRSFPGSAHVRPSQGLDLRQVLPGTLVVAPGT